MLIISRRLGESFIIDDNIEIFILDAQNDKIRIGIEAPKNVKILRKELFETEKSNREAVKSADEINMNALNKMIKKQNK
jgi:carbon storage regulator